MRTSHSPRLFMRSLWLVMIPLVLLTAACSNGSTSATKSSTPVAAKSTPVATTAPATNATPAPAPEVQVTPVSGDYSVYVDPTYGYSFEFPSQWIVYPSIGNAPNYSFNRSSSIAESNVIIAEPYTDDYAHPMTYIVAQASDNLGAQFALKEVCGYRRNTTVASYPATDRSQIWGGDPNSTFGYVAPQYTYVLVAKGIAFRLSLQSSAKRDIPGFHDIMGPVFKHILDTFNPGNGASNPSANC